MKKGLVYISVGRGKYSKINASNAEAISQHSWNLDGKGYPIVRIGGRTTLMHHLIIGRPPIGKVTDHINRDPLDNRIENLRFVTQSQNMVNRDLDKRNRSGFVGVYWHSRQKKWCAKICRNSRDIHVGYYDTPEQANAARIKVVEKIDTL